MSERAVVISRGLPSDLLPDAAALFTGAFGEKLRPAIPSADAQVAALKRVLRPDHIIVAIDAGELLGMVGLSASAGPYGGGVIGSTGAFGQLRELLGLIGAARAIIGLSLGQHRPEHGELYVDGIAVKPAAQGCGVGSRLLAEVAEIAREDGFAWVRLDVVDTNPRAQQLYRRLGYEVTKVQTFGYLRRVVGFGGMTSMELAVGALSGDHPHDGVG